GPPGCPDARGSRHALARVSTRKPTASWWAAGAWGPPRATARGEAAGLQGSAVLCARARAGRDTRAAAQRAGRRTQARTNPPTPARLLRDERGARPLAKAGAALPRPPSALGTGGDHA